MTDIDLTRITSPLRLAHGSHQKGSGRGCIMNVISWIEGQQTITDWPPCVADPLARLAQQVNDMLATEVSGEYSGLTFMDVNGTRHKVSVRYVPVKYSGPLLEIAMDMMGTSVRAGAEAVDPGNWAAKVNARLKETSQTILGQSLDPPAPDAFFLDVHGEAGNVAHRDRAALRALRIATDVYREMCKPVFSDVTPENVDEAIGKMCTINS